MIPVKHIWLFEHFYFFFVFLAVARTFCCTHSSTDRRREKQSNEWDVRMFLCFYEIENNWLGCCLDIRSLIFQSMIISSFVRMSSSVFTMHFMKEHTRLGVVLVHVGMLVDFAWWLAWERDEEAGEEEYDHCHDQKGSNKTRIIREESYAGRKFKLRIHPRSSPSLFSCSSFRIILWLWFTWSHCFCGFLAFFSSWKCHHHDVHGPSLRWFFFCCFFISCNY